MAPADPVVAFQVAPPSVLRKTPDPLVPTQTVDGACGGMVTVNTGVLAASPVPTVRHVAPPSVLRYRPTPVAA